MNLRRNVAMATLGNLAPPTLALVTQPLLAQGLGVDGRGAAAAGVAPLMIAVSLGALGLPESLNRSVAQKALGVRASVMVLGVLALVGALATGVIWSVSSQLSAGSQEALSGIRLAALFVAPALVFQGLRGIAAGMDLWGSIAVARSSQSLLLLILVVYGVVGATLTVASAVTALALAQCAGAIVLGIAVYGKRKTLRVTQEPIARRDFLSYAWTIWLGAAAGYLLVRLDQLLIAPLSSLEQLGLYAVAVSISEVVLVANAGLREVIFSAESATRDPVRVTNATRLSNLVVMLLSGAAALVAPVLIEPLFGADFSRALPMVMLLLAAVVVGNPGSVSGMALAAWGSPGLRSLSISVALAVNIIGIVLLVPGHGGVGAAIATLAGNGVAMVMVLASMKYAFGVRPSEFIVPRRGDLASLMKAIRRRG